MTLFLYDQSLLEIFLKIFSRTPHCTANTILESSKPGHMLNLLCFFACLNWKKMFSVHPEIILTIYFPVVAQKFSCKNRKFLEKIPEIQELQKLPIVFFCLSYV
jgi:hypothetical protein